MRDLEDRQNVEMHLLVQYACVVKLHAVKVF